MLRQEARKENTIRTFIGQKQITP